MSDPRYKYVNMDKATYDKLCILADRNYRTIPGELRRLVDEEIERQEVQPELDEHLEVLTE